MLSLFHCDQNYSAQQKQIKAVTLTLIRWHKTLVHVCFVFGTNPPITKMHQLPLINAKH